MAPVQITPEEMKWLIGGAIGGAFALVTTATGATWKLMDGWVKHWKEMYDAKEKELTVTLDAKERELAALRKERDDARENPQQWAMKYIADSDALFQAKIQSLQKEVQSLTASCDRQAQKIKELNARTKQDKAALILAQEEKERLERKITVCNEVIQQLADRSKHAKESLSVFRDGGLRIEDVNAEIERKFQDIDRTSFPRTAAAAQADIIQKEYHTNAQMQAKLADLQQEELRAQAKEKKAAHLPPDTPFGPSAVNVTRRKPTK